MAEASYDIAIIGGGINGCGIARDAIGRGYSVYLCEQGDLGGATSSASTKLLHGGLRYLEHYEFRLVREALLERETLWAIAPHIVRPLRFVLPVSRGMRPAWLLRLGLFIYDHLGGRKLLPGTSHVDLANGPIGEGLSDGLKLGFEYSDCWVEDNRLVILNAIDAQERGATIRVRTRCTAAQPLADGGWRIVSRDTETGREETVRARMVINAGGPWANGIARDIAHRAPRGRVRQVQGSHIVVPRLYEHDRCFIFQNGDGRIVFTIPYEGRFTLIGTTDRDYPGDPAVVTASDEEVAYLCTLVSTYFDKPVTPADVVWTYSGVRPLYDDGSSDAQAATRDYTLELDDRDDAPILSIFGGKITTYRRLAEAAMEHVEARLGPAPRRTGLSQGWTGKASLPGGEFAPLDFDRQVARLRASHEYLSEALSTRLVRQYGTRALRLLDGATTLADLGRQFGAGLTQSEVDYLCRNEWARTADDIVFRRSKLGLLMSQAEILELDRYLQGDHKERRTA
ncbi:glycerol-3-phosphate dehydrogenase [Agrobacterium sp. a22-2]|uniref:glycerol-3-phosphate dehydrogenase n=1 Tax=Agrobacterium sp. a22-2 TaxID=2283840 RepID=UPI0014465465|nr:glycerol-3-phosphate dehydrogenase [Agrobacterium sp. a22-2]NKN38168.1 glycerol-3-phosphate dehydrogenase [Agrobacterium sp. a22-2]